MAHTGVTIVPGATAASNFQLSFLHPLTITPENKSGKRIKRALNTADGKEATRLAEILSDLIRTPSNWSPLPSDMPAIIRDLWTIKADRSGALEDVSKEMHRFVNSQPSEMMRLREIIIQQQGEIENQRTEIETLKASLREARKDISAEFSSKLLSQAAKDFLSDDPKLCGTNAAARKKKMMRSWLNRFAREIGEDKHIHEVTEKFVIDHLADIKAGKFNNNEALEVDSVKQISKTILAFLNHQSKGTFKAFGVKDWIKKHLIRSVEAKNILWLDETDWTALEKEMAKESKAWASIAALSFWGGFRPEELAFLRQAGVTRDGEARIEISSLRHNGKTYWKPKTAKSFGRVHIPAKGVQALESLLEINKGSFLLMPNIAANGGRIAGDDFELTNNLWTGPNFTECLLPRLRKAAKAIGWSQDKLDRLDSRTMRRSCGKRVLLSSGFDFNKAAAVLRNTPEECRAHYADIIPSDVVQPE